MESDPLQDQMSQLPNDILVLLTSHLSLKEAGAANILSRQWLHVWKSTSRLDFVASKVLKDLKRKHSLIPADQRRVLLKIERDKFVKWVNHVLQVHEGSMLKEFRICFDLDEKYKPEIDSWLQYALSRKVESLEVHLLRYDIILRCYENNYTFPSELLPPRIDFRQLCPNPNFGHLNAISDFKSLKALSFRGVNVSDEVFQSFLSSCSYLEQLVIEDAGLLRNVKVSGPSLVLKRLRIWNCCHLATVKVYNTNLVALEVSDIRMVVLIENVPLLAEVSLGVVEKIDCVFTTISSCLSQLKVLKLRFCVLPQIKNMEMNVYPLLPKLIRLEISGFAYENESLLGYASLIHLAPSLEEFELQLLWSKNSGTPYESTTLSYAIQHLKKVKLAGYCSHARDLGSSLRSKHSGTPFESTTNTLSCPMQHLKKVKLAGYCSHAPDLEVVMFFLQNAVALEELSIDAEKQNPVRPLHLREPDTERKEEVKIRAMEHLEGKIPSRVRLVFV